MANEDQQPRVSNKIKGWAAGMVTVATLATAILTFGTEVLTFLSSKSPTDPASEPLSTAVQAPPSTPGSSNSVVIFKDKFSKPSGKWPREAFDDGKGFDYADGGYRIYALAAVGSSEALINADGPIEDVVVEVDATITDALSRRTWWGIVCRAQDNLYLYRMGITNDGSSYITKLTGDPNIGTDLATRGPSDVVRTGTATNHIRGECVGSKLTLYVNGQKLLEANDPGYQSGKVGLSVATWADEPGTNVYFDNFSVSIP